MKQEWFVQNKAADFNRLSVKFNISPITARLLRNRGLVEDADFEKYLYGTIDDMYDPFLMKGIRDGVNILKNKITAGKKIRVIGDYDIDGVCASHILCYTLKSLGAEVDVDIPHRIIDGYGISKRLIDKAKSENVDTIITCDNGISAVEVLAYGKSLGLTVVLTDHHEVPFEENEGTVCYIIPEADVVINPKQEDCVYPYSELCGAAVAYKLALALASDMAYENFIELRDELLCFCAIATVGDIMPLTDENRIIVKEGLKRISETTNVGLRALISVNNLNMDEINTYHLGFIIGPCINAAGRLESAMEAYDLFNETDINKALIRACCLKELNDKRKTMTQDGVDKAVEMVEKEGEKPLIIVHIEGIHESVSGIVAGRLKELYHKPAFVLAESNGLLKGSARSIESYSMFEKLQECKHLLKKYGGHKMAAGFSLEKDKFQEFKDFLISNCNLCDSDFVEKVSIDFQMPPEYARLDVVKEISMLEPFGNGNPEPLFVERDLEVISVRKAGEKQNVILMDIELPNQRRIRAVYFKDADALYDRLMANRKLTCVYIPKINNYRNNISVQLNIEYFR